MSAAVEKVIREELERQMGARGNWFRDDGAEGVQVDGEINTARLAAVAVDAARRELLASMTAGQVGYVVVKAGMDDYDRGNLEEDVEAGELAQEDLDTLLADSMKWSVAWGGNNAHSDSGEGCGSLLVALGFPRDP